MLHNTLPPESLEKIAVKVGNIPPLSALQTKIYVNDTKNGKRKPVPVARLR